LLFLFVLVSYFFFERIAFPSYIYASIGVLAVYILGTVKRNEFLKNLFTKEKYRKVRLIENALVIAPFVAFLVFKLHFIEAGGVLLVAAVFSLYNRVHHRFAVIPTPFYKNPFEFVVGFRRTYWVFLLAYTLAIIGFFVENFNLAMFALIVVFLACQNFYFRLEPHFYVWIHKQSPEVFLKNKMKTAVLYSFIMTAPLIVALFILYPFNALWIGLLVVVGTLYILVGVAGKYAYYPNELNVFQQIIIGVGIVFPPFSLILLPLFYVKSIKALKIYLK
jgi:hypothetical protein